MMLTNYMILFFSCHGLKIYGAWLNKYRNTDLWLIRILVKSYHRLFVDFERDDLFALLLASKRITRKKREGRSLWFTGTVSKKLVKAVINSYIEQINVLFGVQGYTYAK